MEVLRIVLPRNKLKYFLKALFDSLTKASKGDFVRVVSSSLMRCKDDNDLRMYFHYFMKDTYLEQMREMAAQAYSHGLNIDYFPTNLIVQDELIYYIDYECNGYMEEWNFENWGIKYWSKTPEFLEYLKQHE